MSLRSMRSHCSAVSTWRSRVDFTDLENVDGALAKRLELLVIQAKNLGARDGYGRLALAGKNFKWLSIAEAYHLIDTGTIQSEVEDAQARKYWVGRLHVIRNCLGLCPLILTWFGLYLAASNYQQDLQKHPSDLYEPFLKLWQFGFHNTTWFTFSTAAFIDVVFLGIYLFSIIAVVFLESKAQRITQTFATGLHGVTDELIDAIAKAGATSTSDVDRIVKTIERVADEGFKNLMQTVKSLSEADVDRIAQALKVVIQDALKLSEEIADQAKQTLIDVNTDLKDLINQLHSALGTLGSNLNTLSSDLLGYDQQLLQLTDASTDLAKASNSLAKNADDLTKSTQEYANIGKDIGTQIGSLNGSQQRIITTFEDIKRDAVAQINSFANNLDSAAKATEQVAKDLGQITVTDVSNMSKRVIHAADQVADAADALRQLQLALAKSDQHLQWSLSQADQHLQLSLSQADQHLQNSIMQVETQLQTTNAALLDAVHGLTSVTNLLKGKGSSSKQKVQPQPPPVPTPWWQICR